MNITTAQDVDEILRGIGKHKVSFHEGQPFHTESFFGRLVISMAWNKEAKTSTVSLVPLDPNEQETIDSWGASLDNITFQSFSNGRIIFTNVTASHLTIDNQNVDMLTLHLRPQPTDEEMMEGLGAFIDFNPT